MLDDVFVCFRTAIGVIRWYSVVVGLFLGDWVGSVWCIMRF